MYVPATRAAAPDAVLLAAVPELERAAEGLYEGVLPEMAMTMMRELRIMRGPKRVRRATTV